MVDAEKRATSSKASLPGNPSGSCVHRQKNQPIITMSEKVAADTSRRKLDIQVPRGLHSRNVGNTRTHKRQKQQDTIVMFFSKFTSFAPDYNRKPPSEGPPRPQRPPNAKQARRKGRYGQKGQLPPPIACASTHSPNKSVSSKRQD